MEAKTPAVLVHYFDTQRHQNLCDAHGFEHRSTKHARGVTCPTCVRLLAAKQASSAEGAVERSSHTVG